MADTVLVVAVHPDDETLGCGGTLLKHRQRGDAIHWLIVTGVADAPGWDAARVAGRGREIEAVRQRYGFASLHQWELPTTRLDTLPLGDLVARYSQVFQAVRPSVLYLPFDQDVHSDHRVAFAAAYSCTKSFRYPFIRRICLMETLTETEFAPSHGAAFRPNLFVDISDQMEEKLAILALYPGETGQHPFPRSPETSRALAMLRGSTAGCRYAESFMLIKEQW